MVGSPTAVGSWGNMHQRGAVGKGPASSSTYQLVVAFLSKRDFMERRQSESPDRWSWTQGIKGIESQGQMRWDGAGWKGLEDIRDIPNGLSRQRPSCLCHSWAQGGHQVNTC